MGTQWEGGCLKARKRALTRIPASRHLDMRHRASRTVRNRRLLFNPVCGISSGSLSRLRQSPGKFLSENIWGWGRCRQTDDPTMGRKMLNPMKQLLGKSAFWGNDFWDVLACLQENVCLGFSSHSFAVWPWISYRITLLLSFPTPPKNKAKLPPLQTKHENEIIQHKCLLSARAQNCWLHAISWLFSEWRDSKYENTLKKHYASPKH